MPHHGAANFKTRVLYFVVAATGCGSIFVQPSPIGHEGHLSVLGLDRDEVPLSEEEAGSAMPMTIQAPASQVAPVMPIATQETRIASRTQTGAHAKAAMATEETRTGSKTQTDAHAKAKLPTTWGEIEQAEMRRLAGETVMQGKDRAAGSNCACRWSQIPGKCDAGNDDGTHCWAVCCIAGKRTNCKCSWATKTADACENSNNDGSSCFSSCCKDMQLERKALQRRKNALEHKTAQGSETEPSMRRY